MSISVRVHPMSEVAPMRLLGRGLRAQGGVRLTIRTIREAASRTQLDVAAASQMDQADVSRLEGRKDLDECQVSTLRRYVAALGGSLELVAAFGNKRIVLCGVESGEAEVTPDTNRMQRTRPTRTTKPRR